MSFTQIKGVREVDSVVSETYLRLYRPLETVDLPTPADFYRFAAHKIRQTLLDRATEWRQARARGPEPVRLGPADDDASEPGFDQPDDTRTVTTKAMWSEFYR